MPAGTDPRIGTVLSGRYRVTERLGEGGMGVVYRGERVKLGRPVAIKFLHSPYADAKEFVARFDREARAMSMLSHPCCVSVIDFGVEGEPYIVMDFVYGTTLRAVLDSQRLSPQRAVQIVRQVLTGLAHAHGHGIVHRDIKPGNIMLGEATGIGDHVRIFDFGLAKLQDPSAHGDPSVAHLVGTPAYMAPEQTRGDKIDGRVDLYATGVLLFESLAGHKPFDSAEPLQLLRMQRDLLPPPLRESAPEISEELEAVVNKALLKPREDRFQTAEEFLAALDLTPESGRVSSSLPEPATPSRLADALVRTEAAAPPAERAEPSPREVFPEAASDGRTTHTIVMGKWPMLASLAGLVLICLGGGALFLLRGPAPVAKPARAAKTEPLPELSNTAPPALERDAAALALPQPEPAQDLAMAFKLNDAGVIVNDLSEAALEQADQALNDTAESEAAPDRAKVNVRSLAEALALARAGKVDDAISGVRSLRRGRPNDATLPSALGDLYFQKGWWTDGLSKYREAARLRPAITERATMQKNAIMALGSDKTYARARALLVNDMRRNAVERLRRAAKSDPSTTIRARAKAVLRQMGR